MSFLWSYKYWLAMPVVEIQRRLRCTIVPFTCAHFVILTKEIIDPNRSVITGKLFLLNADMVDLKIYWAFIYQLKYSAACDNKLLWMVVFII